MGPVLFLIKFMSFSVQFLIQFNLTDFVTNIRVLYRTPLPIPSNPRSNGKDYIVLSYN